MLKKLLGALALGLAALVVLISMRPSAFEIKRSVQIKAPAPVVFAQLADFGKWEAWSPWAKLDPNMHKELAGTQGSAGASYYWRGNDAVGEGRMTVEAIAAPERLTIKLEFLKPFAALNTTEFTLLTDAGGMTTVTWAMRGENNFMAKAFDLFMNMDKTVGADFERGLAALRGIAEGQAHTLGASTPG